MIHWTKLLLLTILIHPEDGKPDNYILVPDLFGQNYTFFAIDNDRCLVNTYKDDPDESKTFQVKTIIFTLNQMQFPLEQSVVTEFLKLHPESNITTWLETLIQTQMKYQSLFDPTCCKNLLSKESVPQIALPPQSVTKLYERWLRMKMTLEDNPQVTAMELLIHADPLVGLCYQKAFQTHPNPLSRFDAIAASSYAKQNNFQYRTLVTCSQLLKSQHIAPTILIDNQAYGPEQAKTEFCCALNEHQFLNNYKKLLNNGDVDFFESILSSFVKEAILQQADFGKISLESQSRFVKRCLDKKKGLIGLNSITFVNLRTLTENDLKLLLEHSPSCSNIQLIGLNLKELELTLPNIKFIQIQDSPVILLSFQAPRLKTLVLKSLSFLQNIIIPTIKTLMKLTIEDCPCLKSDKLKPILSQNIHLDKLYIMQLVKSNPEYWAKFCEESFEKLSTEETYWHLSRILNITSTNTLNLKYPEFPFLDSLSLMAVLIYNTSVQIFKFKEETVDLVALRTCENKFSVSLHSTGIKLHPHDHKIPSSIVVLLKERMQLMKENNFIPSGTSIYGLASFLFSLKPHFVNAFIPLDKIKSAYHSVISSLINTLNDDNLYVRVSAAASLVNIGQPQTEVISSLINALKDKDSNVRESAASSLAKIGQSSPEETSALSSLINALKDEDWNVREVAAASLGNIRQSSPEVIFSLINTLKDVSSVVRKSAASSLGKIGQLSLEVISSLTNSLKDEDADVRISVASSLANIGQSSPEVISVLTNAMEDTTSSVRISAASILGNIGQSSPEVISSLINALKDKDWRVRESAASSLVKIGQSRPEVISPLINTLKDKDLSVRVSAASSLVNIGNSSPEVINSLIDGLKDEDWIVKESATSSLGNIRQPFPEVISSLTKSLKDNDWRVRKSAASSLVNFSQSSPKVILTLIDALKDEDSDVKISVASSLGKLEKSSPEVISSLINALKDKDWNVRKCVASILGNIGQSSPEVTSALFNALKDESLYVRVSTVSSLVNIGQSSQEMIFPLVEALADEDPDVSVGAASMLGNIGQSSPEVISCLIYALMNDKDWKVRKSAAFGLASSFISLCPLYFQVYPLLKTITLSSYHSDFIKNSFLKSNGTLMEIFCDSQSSFNCSTMSVLKPQFTWKWIDSHFSALGLAGDDHIKTVLNLVEYLFKNLQVTHKCGSFQITHSNPLILKEVGIVLESLKVWISHQPKQEEEKEQNIIKQPSASLPKLQSLLISYTQSKEIEVSYPPYLDLFKQYRQTLLKQQLLLKEKQNFVKEILDNNSPIHKWVFLEVLEWYHSKLKSQSKTIQNYKDKVELAKKFKANSKKPTWHLLIPILKAYQSYLKEQAFQDKDYQKDHDVCVILWASCILNENRDSLKNLSAQKIYELTGCFVYDTKSILASFPSFTKIVTILKSPLLPMWDIILKSVENHLPVEILTEEISTLEYNKVLEKSLYFNITHTWKTFYNFHDANWKWLGMVPKLLSKCGTSKGIYITDKFHLTHPFKFECRSWRMENSSNIAVLMGSTYFNMDKPLYPDKTLCLDANYQCGHTGATADGYGHFKNMEENEKVHQAAYQTVKHMTRFVYTVYNDPNTLVHGIQELFNHVGQSVKYSFLHPEEAGTSSCVMTRTFQTQEGLVLVAAGLGDGLVAVFDPEQRVFQTIIKPRQYCRGKSGPYTPLSITEKNWGKNRVQVEAVKISSKAVILRMTDGVWEALPFKRSDPLFDESLKTNYLEYMLCDEKLLKWFQALLESMPKVSMEDMQNFLICKIQKKVEKQRVYFLEECVKFKGLIQDFMDGNVKMKCTVGDWIKYEMDKDRKVEIEFKEFFTKLNFQISGIENFLLVELLNQLDHVGFGDDITLHIQSATYGLPNTSLNK